MITTIAQERPTARKEHRCLLCHRMIRSGEKYLRQRNIQPGEVPYVWKECAHCEALVALVDIDWDFWEGINYESVSEHEPRDWSEARLLVMWRMKWTRKDGTLWPVPSKDGAS